MAAGLNYKPGTILGPSGQALNVPVIEISEENARLLRAYKKFLTRYGLRETLYCNDCWDKNLADGCEAHVTDSDILIRCRCKLRHHKGLSK